MSSVRTVAPRWEDVEAASREKAYRWIDGQPEVLLEGDAGGGMPPAEIVLARLLGMDDQIVEDGMRLARPEPVILRPIIRRVVFQADDDAVPEVSLPAARFHLQSGFALVHLDAMYAPSWLRVDRPPFTFRVLYVRYRHRP